MFPGSVSKLSQKSYASAATIQGDADVIVLSGNTQIETIKPYTSGVGSQLIWLIPTASAINLGVAGNIAAAETCPQNKATCLVYVQSTSKWYPVSAA